MEQSPSWEANRFSSSQEIPRILWNPKVHYRIYKHPPPLSLSRASSIQSLPIILTVSVNKPYTNPRLGCYFNHNSGESSEYVCLMLILFAFLVAEILNTRVTYT
jgi:hypothetical protein